jgi:hypothetical protein
MKFNELVIGALLLLLMFASVGGATSQYSRVDHSATEYGVQKIELRNGNINLSFNVGTDVNVTRGIYSATNEKTGIAFARTVVLRNNTTGTIGMVEILIYDRPVTDPELVDRLAQEKLDDYAQKNVLRNTENIIFAKRYPAARHLVDQEPWFNSKAYYVTFQVAGNVMVSVLGDPKTFTEMEASMEFGGVPVPAVELDNYAAKEEPAEFEGFFPDL